MRLAYAGGEGVEVGVSSENWAEERDRLRALLRDYESGKISRFDEIGDAAVQRPTTAERIATIKQRLAALDERLDSGD
jgi:hypothetical protein